MNPINISRHNGFTSNYKLRGARIRLSAKLTKLNNDGSVAEVVETTNEELHRQRIASRPPRKQTAARMARPVETVKVVKISQPVDCGAAIAAYEGRTGADAEVRRLELRIEELMGVLERRRRAEERKQHAIEDLVRVFGAERLR
jgi:hypothetical protein